MDDVNKRLGQLFERLNHNDISGQACDKLLQLCTGALRGRSAQVKTGISKLFCCFAALDSGDFASASDLQVNR